MKHFRDWREGAKKISPGGSGAVFGGDLVSGVLSCGGMYLHRGFYSCWIYLNHDESKITLESDIAL